MLNNREKRYSFLPNESATYRAQVIGDNESRHIRGYGIVFNQKSKIITDWISEKQEYRSFNETIHSNALDDILNNGFDTVLDVNHSFDEILARIASGTLKLTKDSYGIAYDFDAPNTSRGEDTLQMVRRGDYYESSFMFTIAENGDTWEYDSINEIWNRTILKIDNLYDVAICTYRGAYDNTSIANTSRVLEYNKEDIEVASRKLNELIIETPFIGLDLSTSKDKTVETIINSSRKFDEDFITRIYLKRNRERKKEIFRSR